MDISKKDWKLFREKLSDWQENYMEGLVKEYANFLNDDKKPASEKFWEQMLYGLKEDERIFTISKSYLHHEMNRGSKSVWGEANPCA